MRKNWIAVASAEHVERGKREGFMQVCHGKGGPLKRIQPNDRVVYYSPTQTFQGKDKLQAFTAIGVVKIGEPFQVDMGNGFHPFRRNVSWLRAKKAAIHPLLPRLMWTQNNRNWGYQFRFGVFEISNHDFDIIAQAMDEDIR